MIESATLLRVGAGAMLPVLGRPWLLVLLAWEGSNLDLDTIWGHLLEYFLGFWGAIEIYERGGTLLRNA